MLGSWWQVHSCAAIPLTTSSPVPCCQLLESGGCSPDLSTPPPRGGGHPAGPQGAGAMSPSPGLHSCHLQRDVPSHKASVRPAGLASPHWWRAAPWKHHPSSVKAAQFPGRISSAASTLGYTGNTLLCFGAAPFTKI